MSLSSFKTISLQRFSLNFAANIIAALWMLIGSSRAFSWVKPTFMQFAVFALLALGSNVLFSWLVADSGSLFNEQGLISYLIWPTIILLGGIILARRSGNQMLVFVPVVLWLVADSLLVLLKSALQFLGIHGWLPEWSYSFLPLLFLVLFVWQTLALIWIFTRRMRTPWWERIILMVGSMALLTIWQNNVADQPIFKPIVVQPVLPESAFYAQPQLLKQALDNIDSSVAGRTDWYFMGVAGFAGQDVFRSEIDKVRQLFDVRFGTSGHSLALINNTFSWTDEPVATKTSILRGLKTIGQRMNKDEDVLFLALSSHGNEDVFQLDNPPLEMENLDPTWLRDALDASGIRWRVIVVSACYSGSFIDELASPTTVVITASAADKASFGCTNTAEMTYFGQAFFAEGLRDNTSFKAAFNEAKVRVGEREGFMGFEPSEPQMVVGSLMKTALPAFEQVLFNQSQLSKQAAAPLAANSGQPVRINVTPESQPSASP
ncbi:MULTISPECIES: C13 family peptidase [unclassified Psychrobacter]|uniref:C13 family peptidase n=1 Tax=unclassified Psychrobacter TaxID=196806 RepID=UPI0018F3FF67|nr:MULTISPECIES: C13 family peptidase [unclassified Psychrobacter]